MGKRNIHQWDSNERTGWHVSGWEFGKRDVKQDVQKEENTLSVTKNTM
jgi:hypothetical protein